MPRGSGGRERNTAANPARRSKPTATKIQVQGRKLATGRRLAISRSSATLELRRPGGGIKLQKLSSAPVIV